MQHVALITTSYPERQSGSEAAGSFVEDFARELAGHVRVTVIAAGATDSLARDGNLTTRRFAVPKLPLSLLNPRRPGDWLPIVRTLRAGGNALERLARDDRPDLLFGLWVLPSGYWAMRVARRHRIPYRVWALGSDIWALAKVPVVRGVLRRTLRHAEHRYADGVQLARDVESLCGLDCDFLPSVRKLPQPDRDGAVRAAACRLAFLGRWHANKGVDLLLDALGHLSDEDWSRIAEVRICGGGPLHDRVHRAARDLAESGRPVVVQGYLDKPAAAALIGWSDYLLLPSRIESIPVVFSDAMQLQTPVISTPVGDLPALLDRFDAGILADDTSAEAFAAAIGAAVRRDAAACRPGIGQAAREFDLAKTVDRFLRTGQAAPGGSR